MTSQHTLLLLQSLGYPQASTFTASDQTAYRDIIFQLEDKWVRALAVEQRGSLKQERGQAWQNAFEQYLREIDCPLIHIPGNNDEEVLDWLLHLATSYAFEDLGAEQENHAESQDPPTTIPAAAWKSDTVQEQLQGILRLLQTDKSPDTAAEQLMVLKDMIAHQILPEVESSKLGQSVNASMKSILEVHRQTLGFSTKDDDVDSAATLLRMLFIKDLRELQTQIDNAIVAVQEFTHNPQANAALGVLGR